MKDRYEIQHFDYANGGRSWHVYDTVERCHIHSATHGFLNNDKSQPICCTKICEALNIVENLKQKENLSKQIVHGWDIVFGYYVTDGEGKRIFANENYDEYLRLRALIKY